MAESNGRVRVSWSLLWHILGVISAVFLTYSAINVRISLLEQQHSQLVDDVREIKGDVKALLLRRP